MPILAPDRNKGKIAGVIMSRMMPSFSQQMQGETESKLAKMAATESEPLEEEYEEAAALAVRTFWSAMQDGDFVQAARAYKNLHIICDDALEAEEGPEMDEGY